MIIVFSGTDGAGKSTQIEKLRDYFALQGRKTTYLWSRGGYTPLFSMMKKLARKLLAKKLPQQGQSENRDKLLKKRSVSKLWLSIAIIDLILLYGFYARILSWLGRVVICDRYIDDTLIDFTHNFGNSFSSKSWLWQLLCMLAPKPQKAYLLYVSVAVSQYRSKLKNEPFPDSEETLVFRLENYLDETVFPSNKYEKINCEQDIDAIHQLIVENLVT